MKVFQLRICPKVYRIDAKLLHILHLSEINSKQHTKTQGVALLTVDRSTLENFDFLIFQPTLPTPKLFHPPYY